MTRLTRRDLLRQAGAAAVFVSTAAGLAFAPGLRPASAQGPVRFPHGVASGDPASDGAVLWTRVAPGVAGEGPVPLVVQVSRDMAFEDVLLEDSVFALDTDDYTARVRIAGLPPDEWYFYRFLTVDGSVSRIGRTRTAPSDDSTAPLRLVLASCQNFEQGWYGGWARLIADDRAAGASGVADAILHLGDFIYETSPDLPEGMSGVRQLPPFPDGRDLPDGRKVAQTLADYRHLYKTYLTDPALQEARARWPFICTWDDHEFSNDSWQSYETFTSAGLPAMTRKVAANRAWTEFIPARLEGPAHEFRNAAVADTAGGAPDDAFLVQNADNLAALQTLTIYRNLAWGKTADIIVTDTRSYRSPQPMDSAFEDELGVPAPPVEIVRALDLGRTANAGAPPAAFPGKDGADVPNPRAGHPPGTILGARQKAWFKQQLTQSRAGWKLWANSIPAMPLRLDLSALPFQGLPDVAIGIDAWNGYPGELRDLMGFVRDEGIGGVVSCAGDYHMSGAAVLADDPDSEAPRGVALEFAACGISSLTMFGGAERITRSPGDPFRQLVARDRDGAAPVEVFNLTFLSGVRSALAHNLTGSETLAGWLADEGANPYLRYMDTNANGYVLLTITADAIAGEFVTVANANDTQQSSATADVLRRATLKARLWEGGETPQMSDPSFAGTPPFPFA